MDIFKSENFAEIWLSFLELEISRSRILMEGVGSANTYLIMQAVSYHQLRLVYEMRKGDASYSSMVDAYLTHKSVNYNLKKKLNYSTISQWTGLDKETVRRACKNLEKQNVLTIRPDSGIELNLESGVGQKLVALHEKVKPLVTRFLSKAVRGSLTNQVK